MQPDNTDIAADSADFVAPDGKAQTATTTAETHDQWRATEQLSKSSFHKIRRLGLGPHEYAIPGTKIRRITESHESWRARMAEAAAAKAAKLESARARKITKAAGKHAAKSRRGA